MRLELQRFLSFEILCEASSICLFLFMDYYSYGFISYSVKVVLFFNLLNAYDGPSPVPHR